MSARHSVSVAAAVVDGDGLVLAVRRRDNGRWEPPGGVLELGETIHDGLVREVLEETGIVVHPEALTGVYKNMTHGIVALVFRCRAVQGTARPSAEAAETAWLTVEQVTHRMDDAYAVRLLEALTAGPPTIGPMTANGCCRRHHPSYVQKLTTSLGCGQAAGGGPRRPDPCLVTPPPAAHAKGARRDGPGGHRAARRGRGRGGV